MCPALWAQSSYVAPKRILAKKGYRPGVYGDARFRQNNSTNQETLSTLNENETSTGIESTFLNLTFAFEPIHKIQYTLVGLFRYRPLTNDESAS